ncbi:MAG: sugar ABC transporter permease [Sphaerochaetaceae bacterium]|jgi:multiple sugar transport system permease protein|nr:sugar ABC transporter permease [Sphaerochaetaceae bacterium]MDD4218580.1 sugar ABC transporter permease [Sphaerochaetaceae bacterium]
MKQLSVKRLSGDAKMAYVLLAPAAAFIAVFMIYPIFYVIMMSLYRTNKLGILQEFIWFKNFTRIFKQKVFWEVTGRSLLWTAIGVTVKTVVGMIIALCLNVEFRGRKFSRLLFIIPWASSVPISAMLWKWVYDHEFGLLNHTLIALGITQNPPVWLGTPIWSFVSCMWVDIWIGIPFMALVFLAGMQSVPKDLYESAEVDGVNSAGKFFYITIPSIKQIIFIATLLSSLWTFNDFNVIYILTRGGPAGATDILITAIYKNGFEWLRFSDSAVMAVVTFIILMALSIVYARVYFRGGDDTL